MQMPIPDSAILARKERVASRLREVLATDAVIDDPMETRAYECDALTAYRCPPMIAVLPAGFMSPPRTVTRVPPDTAFV